MKLSELSALGYEGNDASLSTSLFEYGFAYSVSDPRSNGDLRVIAEHGSGLFDWADFRQDLDFWKEFDWITPDAFLSYLGLTKEEFDALALNQKISDAIGYYGAEEICGTAYHPFKVTDDSDPWAETPEGFTDYRLPECWACALINGDESGLEASDIAELNAFLEKEKPGQCVDCSPEAEFSRTNDAGTLAGNVLVFRFKAEGGK